MSDHPFLSETREKKAEVVAQGEVDGIEWLALRAPCYGAVNGYVRVPDGHPWYALNDGGYGMDMGVPFGECTWQGGNWFGFDTLHSGQHWPGQPGMPEPYETWMSESLAIEWTEQAARNAANAITSGNYSI